MLKRHNRYPYSALPRRPVYDWPNGRRLAVYIGLNLETFAFGEGMGATLAPKLAEPDVLNYAWRDWGNRVGVWRLLELFDSLRLPVSALFNSEICDEAPELIAAFVGRGDEIVSHGRSNAERQGGLGEDAERSLIDDVTRRLEAATGRPPEGWLGPWISESEVTPDLLAEAGYRYLLDWAMDDQPIFLNARGGRRILAIPYPQELNDIPAVVARQATGAEFADMIVDTFDEMREQAATAPLVMGVALHPYIVGPPHRLRPLRRALKHIASRRDDVWFTTAGAIAAHVWSAHAG
jgi:allantoinase